MYQQIEKSSITNRYCSQILKLQEEILEKYVFFLAKTKKARLSGLFEYIVIGET